MIKQFFILLFAFAVMPVMSADPVWLQGKTEDSYPITVYRSASCGCCKGWIDHLKDHNFEVNDVVVNDVSEHKTRLNVPAQAASCHTAVVNGVAIEGHVPAQDIKRMLQADTADIRLLTVPAMPSGTPGMDTPGATKDAFKVFSISNDNQVGVFNSYTDY
jgi:hypothetical protein